MAKDDQPIRKSSRYDVDAKEGVHTLTIKNVTPADSGVYKCEGTDDSTRTFNVTINGKHLLALAYLCCCLHCVENITQSWVKIWPMAFYLPVT